MFALKNFRNPKKSLVFLLALLCAFAFTSCSQSPAPSESQTPESQIPEPSPSAEPSAPPSETAQKAPADTEQPSEPPAATVWPVNEGVEMTVISWSDSLTINGDTRLNAEIRLPELSGSLSAVGGYYVIARVAFMRYADECAEDAKNQQSGGGLVLPYNLSQDFVIECNAAGLFSVRREEKAQLGGMHASTRVFAETFRVSDGFQLKLNDFFSVPPEEYWPRLLAAVNEDLAKRAEDLFEDWQESAERLFPDGNFCVSQEGLSFFYPELSLAPYAMGVVRVDVPWGAVDGLWTLPS